MLSITLLTLGLASVSSVLATPVGRTRTAISKRYSVFETASVPASWSRLSSAPKSHVLDMKLALKHKAGQDEIAKHLYEISDPSHSRYGQHLTTEQVNELISPLEESIRSVGEWLRENGIHQDQYTESPARDWVSFSIPVEKAESLLDTEYSVYSHAGTDERIVRTERYSLPDHLHEHVDLIAPSIYFGSMKPKRAISAVTDVSTAERLADPPVFVPRSDGNITGCDPVRLTNGCLRAFYNTYDYVPKVPGKNSLGVTGYLGEHANFADLEYFFTTQRPDAAAANYKFGVELANGGTNGQPYSPAEIAAQKGFEANLDVQTSGGFIYPTNYTFYSTGGSPPFTPDMSTPTNTNEPYLEFLEYVLAEQNLPKVFTTSYGDDEQTIPQSYALRVCTQFAQLGLRGISVIFSSGDHGVGSDGNCYTNDGKNTSTFLPAFPAGCPFVTTVGATQNFNPEVAVDANVGFFYSGAGFSKYFPVPAYQLLDVPAYVASLGTKYKGLYNPFGRAYPDVAAQGAPYLIAWNGNFYRVYGTSASCPTFASIITLLNDYLISNGKPALGFLNPWLYTKGRKGLNDILSGSSAGCNVEGFPAAKGWDAVTGLGTPDFKKLLQVLP